MPNDKTEDNGDGKKPKSKLFETILGTCLALVALAVYIATSELFRHSDNQFFFSYWSYWSLLFSSLSFTVATLFLGWSFLPNMVTATALYYPDDEGQSDWHTRWAMRLGGMGQLGHAMIFLACGRMFQSPDCDLWRYFFPTFGTGVALVVAVNWIAWFRHKPLRDLALNTYALTSHFAFVLVCAATLMSAYTQIIFDTVAVLIILAISSTLANIVAQIRYVRKMDVSARAIDDSEGPIR
jgi:hypothetical protein